MENNPNPVTDSLIEICRRLEALEERERRRAASRKRLASAIGGMAVATLLVATVAVADPSVSLDCPGGDLFCFDPNTPARASEVNHNFAQLKQWLEQKVGDAGTDDVSVTGDLDVGGTVSANNDIDVSTDSGGGIVVNGGGGTMRLDGDEIEVDTGGSGLYLNSNAGLPVYVGGDIYIDGNIKDGLTQSDYVGAARNDSSGATDVSLGIHWTKGICFLTQIKFADIDAATEAAECRIFTDGSGNWRLQAYLEGTDDANAWCQARCLVWDRS